MTELTGFGFTTSTIRNGVRVPVPYTNFHLYGGGDLNSEGATNKDGYVFTNVGQGAGRVELVKDGYKPRTIDITFPAPQTDYALEPVAVPRPNRAGMLNILANFCNVYFPGTTTPIFTAFMPLFKEQGRYDAAMQALLEAGSTHVTLSPSGTYNYGDGNGYGSFNWLDQPERFAALVAEISNTVGPNGLGLTPILFLDEGNPDPLPRINKYWPGIANALRQAGVIDRCIVVTAWEPVKGEWTSNELNQAQLLMKQLFPECLQGWHGSPRRWVGSSNPVEPTDPWQGAEAGFAKEFSGLDLDIIFYQAEADAVLFPDCDVTKDDCWLNRFDDGIIRYCQGFHGWRVMPGVCLAEGPAFLFIRGHCTPEDARKWATAGQAYAKSIGINSISFMNGIPY